MYIVTIGGKYGEPYKLENNIFNNILFSRCFSAGWTGANPKKDCIMRREYYVEISKQHLKTSSRKLNSNRQ